MAAVPARATARLASRAASPSAAIDGLHVAGGVQVVHGGHCVSGGSGSAAADRLAGERESELEDFLPGIARLDAFDHAVDPVGPQEFAVEGGGVVLRAVLLRALHAVGRRGSGAGARRA